MKLPLTTDAADQELRDIAAVMRIMRRHTVEVRNRIMHYCMQRSDEFDDEGHLKFESGIPRMPSRDERLHRPNEELNDEEPTDE